MAKKVFLSAGHGGSDPGAVANGIKEKDANLQMLLACKEELERHGVDVVCSRTKDENDPVAQEVKEANVSKADIAVSFHNNAGGGDGFEACYHKGSKEGKELAGLIEKQVKKLGQNSRGLKNPNLKFTRDTNMIAVLCEGAFLDNSKDVKEIDTKAEQREFGVAYAKGILEYLGIEYKEKKESNKAVSSKEESSKKETKAIKYKVQCGAFSEKANAEELQKKLKKAGFEAVIVNV